MIRRAQLRRKHRPNAGAEEVACVVLSWNSGAMLSRCIGSLSASEGVRPRIILVDNGSVDGSPDAVRKEFPEVEIVELGSNTGLAHARNEGVCKALRRGSRFFFLLDDDACVSKDCLANLLQAADTFRDAGIFTPRIKDGNNRHVIWFDGGAINRWGDTIHRNMGKVEGSPGVREDMTPAREAFGTGCSMLIRRDVFERVGFFDESYFMYCEDSEFSFRARAEGFEIMHLPTAVSWHDQSASTRKNRGKWFRDFYVTRNSLRLARRRLSGFRMGAFYAYFALHRVVVPVAYFLVTGQFRRIRAIASGIHDFCAGKFGARYT